MPTVMAAAANGTTRRRRRPARSSRTPLGSTICTATSGSGSKTVTRAAIGVHPTMAPRGPMENVLPEFCAVVPGTTFHGSSAPRSASGSYRRAATSASAFVLPERSNVLHPLHHYVLRTAFDTRHGRNQSAGGGNFSGIADCDIGERLPTRCILVNGGSHLHFRASCIPVLRNGCKTSNRITPRT